MISASKSSKVTTPSAEVTTPAATVAAATAGHGVGRH
jgi:hypothetical protein